MTELIAKTSPGRSPIRRDPLHQVTPGDRWLVVVAHPDDETFGCGSIIASAADRGAHVTVACATRGEQGEQTDAVSPGTDLGSVREAELRQAAELLGVVNVELLGFADSGFHGDLPAGSLCSTPLEVVAARVSELLVRHEPSVVLVLDGSDGHRDHVHLRTAVCDAVGAIAGGAVTVYEHCLSNALMRRWLEEMRATRADTAYYGIDPASLGRPDAEITDELDVAHLLDIRERAIGLHRSQTSPFEGLSHDLRRAFLTKDSLARLAL